MMQIHWHVFVFLYENVAFILQCLSGLNIVIDDYVPAFVKLTTTSLTKCLILI